MASGVIEKLSNDSANGYCKFPDGTLIQWGRGGSYVETATQYTIELPVAFADRYYSVAVTPTGDKPYIGSSAILDSVTTSSFKVWIGNPDNVFVLGFRWIAIGRWK